MIIESLLDTDFYKLSMCQAVLHQFPGTIVEYSFKCRNKANWTTDIVQKIEAEIRHFCTLKFRETELNYLRDIRFFKQDFVDFLELYQPKCKFIKTYFNGKDLKITIKGSWLLTILFEVSILAIVNEVYFEDAKLVGALTKLEEKLKSIRDIKDFKFADFGTRRRHSKDWQEVVVATCLKVAPNNFVGTSNVKFAKDFGIKPIGTMAHEWVCAGQNVGVRLADSQKRMLQAWVDEYRGDLGIALSDTLGLNAFLKDFDGYFAKLYDGVRHDSGDPIWWGEKMLAHYNKLGINSRIKTFVFSDGLTFPEAIKILEHFRGRVNVTFGIGTNLTNDLVNIEPLQIVIKLTSCNGRPVAKISDSSGKRMLIKGQDNYISYLKSVFEIKE